MEKTRIAILGSGNIGTDLMVKIMLGSASLEVAALVGIEKQSEGLRRAEKMDVFTSHGGLEDLRRHRIYDDIDIVFDATSAKAHIKHAEILHKDHKVAIDLTPAAVGPYIVPSVNLFANLGERNMNMVTCGGQATIPIVAAVSEIAPVRYAEIVASISSKSAGPGTRANIDEFTQTTARAIETIGGAQRGKAIIILNPASPPLVMRDTVYCLVQSEDETKIADSIVKMVQKVQSYVPGYRLKQEIQFEPFCENALIHSSQLTGKPHMKVSVFLEVEGLGHYLPKYAGNLDIMTSAAKAVGESLVQTGKMEKA